MPSVMPDWIRLAAWSAVMMRSRNAGRSTAVRGRCSGESGLHGCRLPDLTVVQTVFIGLFAGFALSGNPQLTTAGAGAPEFLIRENAGISRQKIMCQQDSSPHRPSVQQGRLPLGSCRIAGASGRVDSVQRRALTPAGLGVPATMAVMAFVRSSWNQHLARWLRPFNLLWMPSSCGWMPTACA